MKLRLAWAVNAGATRVAEVAAVGCVVGQVIDRAGVERRPSRATGGQGSGGQEQQEQLQRQQHFVNAQESVFHQTPPRSVTALLVPSSSPATLAMRRSARRRATRDPEPCTTQDLTDELGSCCRALARPSINCNFVV